MENKRQIKFVLDPNMTSAPISDFLDRFEETWTPDEYHVWLQQDRPLTVIAIESVSERQAALVACLLASKRGRTVEIAHILVAPSYRRARIASFLYLRLVNSVPRLGVRSLSAKVADDNDPAIGLMRFLRFAAISMLPGQEGQRDKYLFNLPLEEVYLDDCLGEDFEIITSVGGCGFSGHPLVGGCRSLHKPSFECPGSGEHDAGPAVP